MLTENVFFGSQTLMQYSTADKIQKKELEFADEMGAAFMSGSTFLQLFGMAVCFTDMTHIVRERCVELPFRLVMCHTYSAIFANGYTPEEVMNLNKDSDRKDLYSIYLSIVTGELMDTKQSEYYSDYCVYGVEEVSEQDYKSRTPAAASSQEGGGTCFYRRFKKTYVRYNLQLTEDQRQVCTGEGLRSGMIADDCETSASFLKSENKTLMAIRAMLVREGIIQLGGCTSTAQNRDQEFLAR